MNTVFLGLGNNIVRTTVVPRAALIERVTRVGKEAEAGRKRKIFHGLEREKKKKKERKSIVQREGWRPSTFADPLEKNR